MSITHRTRLAHLEHYASMMSSHQLRRSRPECHDTNTALSHQRTRGKRNRGNSADWLSSSAVAKVKHTIGQAWQNSTLQKYHGGVKKFIAFCDRERIPHRLRLPASEHILCAFAASSAGSCSGDSIRNSLSAIRAWHIINNAPYMTGLRLHYTLKGAHNMTPVSSRHPLRPPVSWEMLEILYKELDHSNPEDICILACALAATSGQARLGELLPSCMSKHNPSTHPSVSDLQPPSTAGGSRALNLPTSKTTGKNGATIYLCAQNDCTNPIIPLNDHLRINSPPANFPLFSHRLRDGYVGLTKRRFLKRCNDIWTTYSLPPFTGHSFRIGGTTILLLRGVSPYVVKAMGRWTSDAFLRYWRSLEILAPMHAELLAPYISCILPPKKL
jgi:hypothetical protein